MVVHVGIARVQEYGQCGSVVGRQPSVRLRDFGEPEPIGSLIPTRPCRSRLEQARVQAIVACLQQVEDRCSLRDVRISQRVATLENRVDVVRTVDLEPLRGVRADDAQPDGRRQEAPRRQNTAGAAAPSEAGPRGSPARRRQPARGDRSARPREPRRRAPALRARLGRSSPQTPGPARRWRDSRRRWSGRRGRRVELLETRRIDACRRGKGKECTAGLPERVAHEHREVLGRSDFPRLPGGFPAGMRKPARGERGIRSCRSSAY